MTNITKDVYDRLERKTLELEELTKELTSTESRISSGKYSEKEIRETLRPRRDALRQEIAHEVERAIRSAQDLINDFRREAERANDLDPAALTDDIKLLQAGIPLLPRDIMAILERNRGNRTMEQVALRVAKERGIDTRGVILADASADAEATAKGLEGILHYYRRWIDKPNALEMLDKFFAPG